MRVILSLTSFQVIFSLMFPPFLIEQLEGMMESGSTVSSSFGRSPDLHVISHFGSHADDAPVKTKLEILLSPSLIAYGQAREVKLLVHS